MTETEALLLNALEQLQTTHSATYQALCERLETLEQAQGNLVSGYNGLLRAQEELEQSQAQLASMLNTLLQGSYPRKDTNNPPPNKRGAKGAEWIEEVGFSLGQPVSHARYEAWLKQRNKILGENEK